MAEKYTSAILREVKGKDGKRKAWKGVLKYKDTDGKWKQVAKTFGAEVRTKTQANKALQAYRKEMEAKAKGDAKGSAASSTTIPDAVDTFLDGWDVEGSTMRSYRNSAKHIRREFEGKGIDTLTPQEVRTWIGKLRDEGYSLSLQGKCYRLLNMVLKHLVLDEVLDRNVCDAVKPPKREKADPNALTNAGREKLVSTLSGMEPTALVVGAMAALFMGLREGEVCGLRWCDVDLSGATLTVRNAIGNRKGGTYEKAPKTNGSERTLPIPSTLLNVLTARRSHMFAELQEKGVEMDAEEFGNLFVIGYVDGRYKNPTMLGREWKALAEALNLQGTKRRTCTFHDLRHTFATVAVTEGTDIKSVSSFMGHSNAAMTLNVYASSDADALRIAAAKQDAAYDFEAQRKGQADVISLPKTGTDNN